MNAATQRGSQPPSNSVRSLIQSPFERRTLADKLQIKALGPDQPCISVAQQVSEKGKKNTRSFSPRWYGRKSWLTGCCHANALFCFPCLLFQTAGTDAAWTATGVRDMKHLSEKIKKHECARAHMENTVKLALLGRVGIATQLDERHRSAVRKHNQEVDKNRHVLSKIIDCVKFCGAFELALCGHGETSGSPGVFRGLVDLVASLDSVFEEHLNTSAVFKGTSKTVQNELLDCMLSVLRGRILEEVKTADYLAIQVDETTDSSSHCQLVLVLRYIDVHNNVQERFFEFIRLQNATADTVSAALLERLSTILPTGQEGKLIAQAYDGPAVMRGATGGVQRKVKDVYGHAHYVHCYAHPLNLIVQQATAHIPGIGAFFSDLGGFAEFFSQSLKRSCVLDQVMAHRLPGSSIPRWDFHSRAANTVYEHNDDLLRCFQAIRDSGDFDPASVREAGSLVRMLHDEDFCFFLALFHKIMPRVELLFKQLQKKNIDSDSITAVLQRFRDSMQTIRDSIPSLHGDSGSVEQSTKKVKIEEEQQPTIKVKIEEEEEQQPTIKVKIEEEEQQPTIKVKIEEEEQQQPTIKVKIEEEEQQPIKKVKIEEEEQQPTIKVKIEEEQQQPTIKVKIEEEEQQPIKKVKIEEEQQWLAAEVCDMVLSHAEERFSFTKHLVSATLLQGDLFPQHRVSFPDSALEAVAEAYPALSKAKLKTELSLIYRKEEFKACSRALTLFHFFMDSNLQNTFTETVGLLRILLTTPMTTAEPERCFSTLQRIKTFVRNAVTQERLNALAMLSIEKNLIGSIPDFNARVIESFAGQTHRRAKFLYK